MLPFAANIQGIYKCKCNMQISGIAISGHLTKNSNVNNMHIRLIN